MAELLLMPEVAAGDEAAVISEWVAHIGNSFRAGDTLAILETAKAAVDLPADTDGVLIRLLVEPGDTVQVGAPIALLGAPGETVGDPVSVLAELGVGSSTADSSTAAPPPEALALEEADPPTAPATGASRIFASPLARKMAKDSGIALSSLSGTGPDGRIVRDDVRVAIAAVPHPTGPPTAVDPEPGSTPDPSVVSRALDRQAVPVSSAAGHTDVPHTRMRLAIARRLVESVTTAPQFVVSGRARVDRLLAVRRELLADAGVKVSVNDLVVKAVAAAHVAVPAMNVIWLPDAVRQFSTVDVAIAVRTPNGLLTPVLRDVANRPVTDIAAIAADLADQARAGRLGQCDLEGGSISVSNLGMYGIPEFTAIVNPPHAAILAVGAAQPEVVVDSEGQTAVAQMLRLNVSVDHRPVDGAVAAEWMRALVDRLEHPLGLLL